MQVWHSTVHTEGRGGAQGSLNDICLYLSGVLKTLHLHSKDLESSSVSLYKDYFYEKDELTSESKCMLTYSFHKYSWSFH